MLPGCCHDDGAEPRTLRCCVSTEGEATGKSIAAPADDWISSEVVVRRRAPCARVAVWASISATRESRDASTAFRRRRCRPARSSSPADRSPRPRRAAAPGSSRRDPRATSTRPYPCRRRTSSYRSDAKGPPHVLGRQVVADRQRRLKQQTGIRGLREELAVGFDAHLPRAVHDVDPANGSRGCPTLRSSSLNQASNASKSSRM